MASEGRPLPPKGHRGTRLSLGAGRLAAAAFLGALVSPAAAVPVPYHNCGKPTDILSVSSLNASVWPPPTAAPLAGVATIDAVTGQLTNLHVVLLFGADWIFDSGSLATGVQSGFVTLPASVPLSVTSPPLPVAAGPYDVTHTFTSRRGGGSVTVVSKANVAQSIPAAVTAFSLTFNGVPGFPVPPRPGSYAARVQMALPSSAEVFCVDLALANISFVTVATLPQIPTLSRHGLATLVLLLAGLGLLARYRWPPIRS